MNLTMIQVSGSQSGKWKDPEGDGEEKESGRLAKSCY